jgi:hypothetical protein
MHSMKDGRPRGSVLVLRMALFAASYIWMFPTINETRLTKASVAQPTALPRYPRI